MVVGRNMVAGQWGQGGDGSGVCSAKVGGARWWWGQDGGCSGWAMVGDMKWWIGLVSG